MSINRRNFIRTISLGTLAAGTGLVVSRCKELSSQTITILHTNDLHSQIDPFPPHHPYHAGKGGFAKRAALIDRIRKEQQEVILLDAGDIFQGTPYFNFFKGDLEIELMNRMQYDASTFGNHEFDNGVVELAKQLAKANFPFLNCNYDLSESPLQAMHKPFITLKRGEIKIGIIGVGIELNGLVDPNNIGNITYSDPLACVEKVAAHLKHDEKCDLIIGLSHLGYRYKSDKVSDQILAHNTNYLDVIIGGHTHTFMPEPELIVNKHGKQVVINQVGWGGINLGRLDIQFDPFSKTGQHILSKIYHVG